MTTMTDTIPIPYDSYRGSVLPEWIDMNGHMNVAYYVLAFDKATDGAYDQIGMDDAFRKRTESSTFATELHVNYHQEIKLGDEFYITSTVLGVDHKRINMFHAMYHAETHDLVATNENMFLCIDMRIRKTAPFEENMLKHLQNIAKAHAELPMPKNAGRSIIIPAST